MSKTNKNIPELRFPEFVNDGEWEKKLLGKVCEYWNGGSHESGVDESGEYYLISLNSINIEGNLNSDMKRINYTDNSLQKDDLVMVLSDIAHGNFLGLTAIIPGDNYVLNQRMAGLRIKEKSSVDAFFLRSFINYNQDYFKANGQGSSQLNLSKSSVTDFPVSLPIIKEQQKIASCLSSLDELITGEEQRLEQLSEHKKGLMQNLFPNPSASSGGETIPKYRFPEFEKDGEWEEKTLGEIGNPLMCKRILKEQTTTNSENNVPFFKIGTFGKEADAYIDYSLFEEFKEKNSYPKIGDILISASGTIGRLVVFKGEPSYFQDSNIIWLGNDENLILNVFLYYVYSILDWQTSDGGVIRRLYNSDFKGMTISFPPNKKEQQKIASCLSSLDELIQAQTGRIEELKEHKKGLMQKLFPNPDSKN